MQVEFEDDDLRRLYTDPGFRLARMGPDLVTNFHKKLEILAGARDERDLRSLRSLRLEKLSGDRIGQHSIRLNDQWLLILRFRTTDDGRVAVVIQVVDYH